MNKLNYYFFNEFQICVFFPFSSFMLHMWFVINYTFTIAYFPELPFTLASQGLNVE